MSLKKLYLSISALTLFAVPIIGTVTPFSNVQVVQATQEQISKQAALGASLSQADCQRTLQLLQGTDVANVLYIDGPTINSLLNDGSTASTNVYSSVVVEPREAGYGVQVQILTPDTILNVSPQTYQNAALTAGAKDVLIRIASLYPVTGEGALAGVYRIYNHQGRALKPQEIHVAEQEIKIVNNLTQNYNITNYEINQIISQIKLEINQTAVNNTTITAENVEQIVAKYIQHFEQETGKVMPEEARRIILDFMKEYVASVDLNQSQSEQIQASTANTWTPEQAIDFWEGHFIVDPNQMPSHYDRSYWEILSNEGPTIRMRQNNHQDNPTFELTKSGEYTIIAQSSNDDPATRIEYLVPNNNIQTIAGIRAPQALADNGKLVWDVQQIRQYLVENIGLEAEALGEIQLDPEAQIARAFYTPQNGEATDLEVNAEGWVSYLPFTGSLPSDSSEAAEEPGQSGEPGESSDQAEQGSKDILNEESTAETSEDSSDVTEATTYWNIDKYYALDNFIKTQWNANYLSYSPYNPGDMYGVEFPVAVMASAAFDGHNYPTAWSEDGMLADTFNVVAAYSNYEAQTMDAANWTTESSMPTYYLFVIYNGQPMVFQSQQNQGSPDGMIHFTSGVDANLYNTFVNIVGQ